MSHQSLSVFSALHFWFCYSSVLEIDILPAALQPMVSLVPPVLLYMTRRAVSILYQTLISQEVVDTQGYGCTPH